MSWGRRCAWIVGIALLVGASAPAGEAQAQGGGDEPATVEAAEHFDRGIEFFNEGRYDAALAEFRRAYELAPAYQVLYNLGRVHAELGHAVEAADAYQRYLDEGGRHLPARRRREVEAALQRQLARIAKVQVEANVEGAVVSVDGVDVAQTPLSDPLRVSAGSHTVGVRAPGFEGVTRGIQVAGGDEQTVSVELRREMERMGTLRIQSSVPDVEISIDDAVVGTTPLGMTVPVTEGNHLIVGTRPGYEPAREWVSVAYQAEVDVQLQMRRSSAPDPGEVGEVRLHIPDAPYVLKIDGEPIIASGGRLELPVGKHHLRVEVADRLPYETEIEVEPGRPVEVVLILLWTPEMESDLMASARHRRRVGQAFTFSGLGLIAGGVGVLAWIQNQIQATDAEIRRLNELCKTGCTSADMERGTQLAARQPRQNAIRGVSIATAAVGLLGSITGLVLWVGAPSDAEIDAAARAGVQLELFPGGLRLRGRF